MTADEQAKEWRKAQQVQAATGVLTTAIGYCQQHTRPPKAVRDQLRFYLDRVWNRPWPTG